MIIPRAPALTGQAQRRPRALLLVAAALVLTVLSAACSAESAAPTAAPGSGTTATVTPTATATVLSTNRPLGTLRGTNTTIRDPAFEALAGANARFGTHEGAAFRIELPDEWNGELVLYAHGFRGFGDEVWVSSPPSALRQALISGGYAWAASSYRENGYVPGLGADDTIALLRYFEEEVGQPERVYLAGTSMGGNVIVFLLEHHPELFAGGLSLCGAVGGQEQIDYLLSWALLAEYFAGTELPIGGSPAEMTVALLQNVLPALGDPTTPTLAGERFASAVRELTGGRRPFFQEGLAEQFELNFGLIVADPARELVATAAATNINLTYDIDPALGLTAYELNAGVRRLEAEPGARDPAAHPGAVPTTGELKRPLLTLHTTGDLFVPINQEVEYARKAREAGRDHFLVQRAIRAAGHCEFSNEEQIAAWQDLVRWVESGEVPPGDDLEGDLRDAGHRFTDPERPGAPGGL